MQFFNSKGKQWDISFVACFLTLPSRFHKITHHKRLSLFPKRLVWDILAMHGDQKLGQEDVCVFSELLCFDYTLLHWLFELYQWRIQDVPLGGGGGRRPPMHTLFGKNVCENERNGSCWGGHAPAAPPLDPPMFMTHLP